MIKLKISQGKFTIEIERSKEKAEDTISQFIEWLVRLTNADEITWNRFGDTYTTTINGHEIEIKKVYFDTACLICKENHVRKSAFRFSKPFRLEVKSNLKKALAKQIARQVNFEKDQQRKKREKEQEEERRENADKARHIMSKEEKHEK